MRPPKSTAKKILFTAVKNEGPFLIEWIAYHRSIGFDQIIIASNDSTDGTTELLNQLDFEGLVTHLYHRPRFPVRNAQRSALRALNKSCLLNNGDWLIWLDADEFLNIKIGKGNVDDLVDAIGNNLGMTIPWRIFGDSGNKIFRGRFISNSFSLAAKEEFDPEYCAIKTFFRYHRLYTRYYKGVHMPRIDFQFLSGRSHNQLLNSNGERSKQQKSRSQLENASDFSYRLAQVNHYSVRTEKLFSYKKSRGRGNNRKSLGVKRKDRHTVYFFETFNKNECVDTSILIHEQATVREIRKILKSPRVLAEFTKILKYWELAEQVDLI